MKIGPLYEYQSYHINELLTEDISRLELKNKLYQLSQKTKLFQFDGSILRTSKYVGILGFNEIIIQVLPKLLRYEHNKTSHLLSNLFYILSITKTSDDYLEEFSSETNYSEDLFELIISTYAKNLLRLLLKEPISRYETEKVNTTRPKGKIDLNKTLMVQITNKSKTICTIDQLTFNNKHLRFFKFICIKCLAITDLPETKRTLNSCLKLMADVKHTSFDSFEASKIVLQRQHVNYKKTLSLALMILRSISPTFNGRNLEPISIEFDMNYLFEKYVNHLCQKYKHQLNIDTATAQRPVLLIDSLLNFNSRRHETYNRSGRIDTLLKMKHGQKIILDAKYKIIEKHSNIDITLQDIYQISTYEKLITSSKKNVTSALIYPAAGETYHLQLQNQEHQLKWFIKTLDLHKDLRNSESEIVAELRALLECMVPETMGAS